MLCKDRLSIRALLCFSRLEGYRLSIDVDYIFER